MEIQDNGKSLFMPLQIMWPPPPYPLFPDHPPPPQAVLEEIPAAWLSGLQKTVLCCTFPIKVLLCGTSCSCALACSIRSGHRQAGRHAGLSLVKLTQPKLSAFTTLWQTTAITTWQILGSFIEMKALTVARIKFIVSQELTRLPATGWGHAISSLFFFGETRRIAEGKTSWIL